MQFKRWFILILIFILTSCADSMDEEENSSSSSSSSGSTSSQTGGDSSSDSTAPANASLSINEGNSTSTSRNVTIRLSATDNVGITAYYISESITTPGASANGWTTISTTTSYNGTQSYSFTTNSTQNLTLYSWFKDEANNISVTTSDEIDLTPVFDTATFGNWAFAN